MGSVLREWVDVPCFGREEMSQSGGNRCETCRYWCQTPEEGVARGICVLSEEGRKVSLHSVVLMQARTREGTEWPGPFGCNETGDGVMRVEGGGTWVRGVLLTDGTFGCVSWEPRAEG
jgi:hypothetical protein